MSDSASDRPKYTILCLIGQLGNGGSEKQLYLFLKHLDKDIFSPVVLVSNSSNNFWERRLKEELNVPVYYLSGAKSLFKLISFRRLLRKLSPDIIFSWSFYTNIYKLVTPASIKFIGSLRVQIKEEKEGLNFLHFKIALSPEIFIVNSQRLSEDLIKYGVENAKIKVIYNIFERKFGFLSQEEIANIRKNYRDKFNIPQDALVILGMGRNSPGKDFPFFVRVLKELIQYHDKNTKYKIYGCIIGQGGNSVKELINQNGLSGRIVLPGEIPDAWQVLPFADIFFLSSKIEGMPNVLLEAIDAGCGIVTTNVGGVSEITGGYSGLAGENGIIIENGDTDKAVTVINKLISDNDLRTRISRCLINRLKLFSPEAIMKCYMEILKSCIDL